jgi:hypothetical protein
MSHIQSNVKIIGCSAIALHLQALLSLHSFLNTIQQQGHDTIPSSRNECHVSYVLDIIFRLCSYV